MWRRLNDILSRGVFLIMCFFHSSSVIANFTVFHNLLMVLSSSNLHEPKGLESALTCLIIRAIYGETMATPQFTVISPVGNSPYKAAGEKNSSDAASHWNPDKLSTKLWWHWIMTIQVFPKSPQGHCHRAGEHSSHLWLMCFSTVSAQ